MAMFDTILDSATSKFGMGKETAGALVAAILGLLSDPARGGIGGFLDSFRNAGLGDKVSSWIGGGPSEPLTDSEVETALGRDAINSVAGKAGVDPATATSAMSGIIPSIVDSLTPDGTVPDNESVLSRIGGFLSSWGGAIGGAVAGGIGAAAAGAGKAADSVSSTAARGVNRAGAALDDATDSPGSFLKWLIPLLLLGLLILLGFWFCGRGTPTGQTNVNVNAGNRTVANANSAARPTNTTSNSNASNSNTNSTSGSRTLSEVSLPNGTTLQAYSGGIEDQLVRFIGSNDYKNGTADTLKDKWFNFDDLNFKFGTSELAPESKRQMDNIVAILKAFPDVKIKIGGYTDKKGDDAQNLKLSDQRAKAVKAALEKAGVGAQVPEAEGYGEQFATVDENASDDARKVDRKTSVRLLK